MAYREFLDALFMDGRVIMPEVSPLLDQEVEAGDVVIAEFEQQHRLEIPGTAPRHVVAASRWAGTRFFRACQFLVYRDVDEQAMDQELRIPCPESVSPDVHYSVDLVFRFLPDVTKLSSAVAAHDPLLEHLGRWARQWPLSSVGIPGMDDVDVGGFENDVSLMRLYVDRIINKNDKSRLANPAVRNGVQRALGMFPDLAEGINAALLEYDRPDHDDQQAIEQQETT